MTAHDDLLRSHPDCTCSSSGRDTACPFHGNYHHLATRAQRATAIEEVAPAGRHSTVQLEERAMIRRRRTRGPLGVGWGHWPG